MRDLGADKNLTFVDRRAEAQQILAGARCGSLAAKLTACRTARRVIQRLDVPSPERPSKVAPTHSHGGISDTDGRGDGEVVKQYAKRRLIMTMDHHTIIRHLKNSPRELD
jgi:hypothetical protein